MNTSRSLSVLDRLEIFELFAIDVSEQNHVLCPGPSRRRPAGHWLY